MFNFDIQLFNLGGGGQEIGDANNYYQGLASQGNQIFGTAWPMIQGLISQGQGALSGAPNSLSESAQAPVQAETSQEINSLQGQLGGVANPGSVIESIGSSGQQAAGLSADQLLSSVYSSLMSLGGGLVGQSGQNINAAAGGEAGIGTNLNTSATNFWSSLLGAVGTAAGAGGIKSAIQSTGTNTASLNPDAADPSLGQVPVTMGNPIMDSIYGQNSASTAPPGASVTSTGQSAPLSGGGSAGAGPSSFYGGS